MCTDGVSGALLPVLCMPNARQGALLFQPRWQWESSFFHLLEPCGFPSSPIFTFHLNQPSTRKSKYYYRPHLTEMKAQVQMRTDYAPWRQKAIANRTTRRKVLQDA